MNKYQKTVSVYELHDGFRVEVEEDITGAEFWLAHEDHGVKAHMFGTEGPVDVDALVADNAQAHIEVFKAEYFD
jgi:hypothetical protein